MPTISSTRGPLAFADDIMRITNGEGVDCVLNSLAGDFIPKSFSVLRTFGASSRSEDRHLQQLEARPRAAAQHISYFVVDLAQHLQDKPEYVAEMFAQLARKFDAEYYKPLPHTSFPITDVVEAFRNLAQGKHVGKNVLNFDVPSIKVAPCTEEGHLFKADASYLDHRRHERLRIRAGQMDDPQWRAEPHLDEPFRSARRGDHRRHRGAGRHGSDLRRRPW